MGCRCWDYRQIHRVGKGASRRAHHRINTNRVMSVGGHAEPVIGRAFARPVGFAHPTNAYALTFSAAAFTSQQPAEASTRPMMTFTPGRSPSSSQASIAVVPGTR